MYLPVRYSRWPPACLLAVVPACHRPAGGSYTYLSAIDPRDRLQRPPHLSLRPLEREIALDRREADQLGPDVLTRGSVRCRRQLGSNGRHSLRWTGRLAVANAAGGSLMLTPSSFPQGIDPSRRAAPRDFEFLQRRLGTRQLVVLFQRAALDDFGQGGREDGRDGGRRAGRASC